MKVRSYSELVRRIGTAAANRNLEIAVLGEIEHFGVNYPILMLRLGCGDIPVCVSAGIHGDEPAGVEAAARFIEGQGPTRDLVDRFSITVYPCDNPSGYELGTRENARGIDLNREFRKNDASPEVKLLMDSLATCNYQLFYEMHEDVDSPGFYLYELAADRDKQVGHLIVERAREMQIPINTDAQIEDMPASGGIINAQRAQLPVENLPKAVYLYHACANHVITMEPPASLLSLEKRVNIQLIGLDIALRMHAD